MKHRLIPVIALAVLAAVELAHQSSADDAVRSSVSQAPLFLPFDFYPRHREALGLSDNQLREMQRVAEGMREAAQKLEKERAGRTKALEEIMAQHPIEVDKAMARLQAVLEAENELKALRFRIGISMRNSLSPEQIGKVQTLAMKEAAARGGGVRAEFSERLQQLKAEILRRTAGEPPLEIVEGIQQIERTAKEDRFGEAKNQLEQVLRRLRELVPAPGDPSPSQRP